MRRGFSLIEVILAGSIFALLVTALVGPLIYGRESSALAGARSRALLIAEEGLEAARSIRDGGYADLADGPHGLAISGNRWTFSGTEDTDGSFTRQVVVASIDERRKSVVSTVAWQQNAQRTGSVSLTTRLTRWKAATGTWASPYLASVADLAGTLDGLKVQVSGNYAYVVRADGAADFIVVDITDPAVPTAVASLNLSGAPTNIAIVGTKAYVSSRDDSQELQIIDIATPTSPSVAGTFNAPGSADALGLFAVNTDVYLVRASSSDNELVSVSATIPALPLQTSSLNLGADGNEVMVIGSNVLIASSHDTQELQVANIGFLGILSLSGTEDLAGTSDALSIAAFGTTAVLGRADGGLHVVSVSTPANPSQVGSYAAGASANDVSLGNSNAHVHVASASSSAEYQVVSIQTPSAPVQVGTFNISGTSPLNGVAHHAAKNRTVAVGGLDAREFLVFAP